MTDQQIDALLASRAAGPRAVVTPAVLERITAAVHSSLRPVRPIPGPWLTVTALLLMCIGLALAGAARSGFAGLLALEPLQRVMIFAVLAGAAGLTAKELVSHWIPGSRHYLTPPALIVLLQMTLLCTFALLFHSYHIDQFASAGVACLSKGVLHAIPAACLAVGLLRRGYAMNPIVIGTIAGALGGVTGVATLELVCPNLAAPHVLVWHVAVVPASALAGTLTGWLPGAWSFKA
jgi:hypothetical protein